MKYLRRLWELFCAFGDPDATRSCSPMHATTRYPDGWDPHPEDLREKRDDELETFGEIAEPCQCDACRPCQCEECTGLAS